MYDVKKMNIWKDQPEKKQPADHLTKDIAELGLSVRSYNCLKRAGCSTVGDVEAVMESEKGLLTIRNLGSKSAKEIKDKIEECRAEAIKNPPAESVHRKTLIKPAKKYWDCRVDEFGISAYAKTRLNNCGIRYVRDLYTSGVDKEPGWYAVRELFEKIPI